MFSVQLSDKSSFKLLVTSTKFSPQNQHLQGKSWSLVPPRFCGLGFSLQILQSEWFIWAAWVRFKCNPKPPLWSELHVVEVPRSVSPWHRVNYSFTFPEVFFSVLFFTVCFCHSCLSFITTLSAVSDINSSLTFKLTGGKNIITPGFSKIWVKKCQRRQKKLLWKFKFPVVHLSSWMDRHSWTGGDEEAAWGTIIRYVTQRRYVREKKGGEEKRSGGEIREWESRTDCSRHKTTTWVNCGIRLLQPTFTF